MQDYPTIIGIIDMRLRGISYEDCCGRYKVGHSTVTRIMSRYKELDKTLEELKQMAPAEVENKFYPPENVRRKDESIMPDFAAIYERITRSGSKANLYFMWLRYKKEHPTGYQYTQFCRYYNEYVARHYGAKNLSMAVERVPGERMYIDWIGDQPEILVDPHTGELAKVHFFVTTVGVSSCIYAEAFKDEKLDNFIAGTVHALEYYEAVPKYLVPDNLRAAVTKHTKDELVLNSAYQDLENFYDVVVLPPPARKPTGKATVEGGVRWLETHLLEDLKDKAYYSLDEVNHDVQLKVAELKEPLNNSLYPVPTRCISRHLRLVKVISAQNSHYLSAFLLRFPKKGRLPLCQVVESFRPAMASTYRLAQANMAYSRFSLFFRPRYTAFL